MTTLTMGGNMTSFGPSSLLRSIRLFVAITQRMSARKDLLNCSKRNLKHERNVSMSHGTVSILIKLVAFEHFHDIFFSEFGH